ncbi:ABC transporter E member 2, partial [Sarracenia purpurea var. burkii]
ATTVLGLSRLCESCVLGLSVGYATLSSLRLPRLYMSDRQHSCPRQAIIKPQYVDHIPKAVQGNVGQVLDQKDERGVKEELCVDLELNKVLDRNVGDLSGGELQRFAIAVVAIQNAEIYMFDEPSSYLDVKQRLKAAQVVRSLLRPNTYVIVVEHDLSVLDYLSDFICCLYGKPGAYGVVTLPFSVREGINIFLAGFVPTENLRFRDESLTFKVAETPQESAEEIETYARYKYPTMTKTQGNFKLRVMEGEFTDSQIIVMLGENGTGKTTFIRMLAGLLKPDVVDVEIPEFNVSYKPQKISPKFQYQVRNLLHQRIRDSYMHPQFVSDVMKPLQIEQLMDQEVVNLSGGELQRVALCLCLGKTFNDPSDDRTCTHSWQQEILAWPWWARMSSRQQWRARMNFA